MFEIQYTPGAIVDGYTGPALFENRDEKLVLPVRRNFESVAYNGTASTGIIAVHKGQGLSCYIGWLDKGPNSD
jgi:hypothetical protein